MSGTGDLAVLRDLLDRCFGLTAAGTDVRTELLGGVVTFATLSYILFVQPALLGEAPVGMDRDGVLFATCVGSAIACFLMAWWANYPIALAPAMGHNFFFAFSVCGALGWRWQEALAANALAGLAFLLLARVGVREKVMDAIPESLKSAIASGIGLLIALIGLEWGGLVRLHTTTLVQLGELSSPVALLTLFGLAVSSILLARGTKGALLLGILATAAAGLAASALFHLERPLVQASALVGAPPSPVQTAFRLDFAGLFARPWAQWLPIVGIFLFLVLFDTVGTLVGVARKAGLMADGRLPRARQALAADAAGTVAGTLLGTSTISSYVESAAGVATGARTGLASVATGLCLLLALFFTPAIHAIGGGIDVGIATQVEMRYPVIAPTLILVGCLMAGELRRIDWDDLASAIPAFLCVVVMQLSVSITEGIAFGFIATSLLALATGKARRTPVLVHACAALFLARYLWLAV